MCSLHKNEGGLFDGNYKCNENNHHIIQFIITMSNDIILSPSKGFTNNILGTGTIKFNTCLVNKFLDSKDYMTF